MKTSDKDGGNAKGKTQRRQKSPAKRILTLISKEDVTLFHDEKREAYVRIPIDGRYEIWSCRSEQFKDWLARLAWTKDTNPVGSEALNSALGVLRAKARFDGKAYRLDNRVARADGAIWYDLGDSEWRAVKIIPGTWDVIEPPPILFRRFSHQRPQVEPLRYSGDLKGLLHYINIRDETQGMFLLVWLVSCLVPDIPHPVLVLHGPQGSAKTTALRMARRLIDPSTTEVLTMTRDGSELVQQFSHHWAPFFDNVHTLPQWVSDAICRAVTGDGFSKRRLYTDDDDVIYSFRRCVGLGGVNVAAYQPDLLDRCLVVGLERISEKQCRPEEELWPEFENALPGLASGMFTVLAQAMAIRSSIRLSRNPRMADFAAWGCAIAVALGWTQDAFLSAYEDNTALRHMEALDNSPVAMLVIAFMEDQPVWEGEPTELLTELESVAAARGISTDVKRWPKAANALTRRLKELVPDLEAVGIRFQREPGGQRRCVRLSRVTAQDSPRSDGDGNDGIETVSSAISSRVTAGDTRSFSIGDDIDGISPTVEGRKKEKEYIRPGRNTENTVKTVYTVSPQLTASDSSGCNGKDRDGISDNIVSTGPIPSRVDDRIVRALRRRMLPANVEDWPDEYRELFEERAAISEFDGERGRACAEIFAQHVVDHIFGKKNGNGNGGDPKCGVD
ncbi:MAG: hypothetical protein ABIJ00_12525 [Candidatus Eisenbacteria bacterium]